MSTTLSSPHVLRLYHGAGRIHEVPADAVQRANGSTLEALRQLAAQEIRDPELIHTLSNGKVVIQAFSDADDEVHQQPVSPDTDFARFASLLRERDVEMSASVRHEGGL